MLPTSLNDDELQRVIARARAIDAHDDAQLTRLRDLAAQLNISPSALNQALAEITREKDIAVTSASVKAPLSVRARFQGWLAAATVGVGTLTGYAAGTDYRPPGGDSLTEFTVFMLIGLSISMVAADRKEARPWSLFGRMAVLWACYGYGWAVGHGQLPDWALEFTLVGGAISVAAGGVLHQAIQFWRRLSRRKVHGDQDSLRGLSDASYVATLPRHVSKGAQEMSTPLPPHFSTPI